jgi:hypothetical protein
VGASLGPSLGGCQNMDLDFQQSLQNFLKLGHRWSKYKFFFTKLYLKPPSHLHHHVGKLHPTSMDRKGSLHNVNRLSTYSTFGKIDLQSHLRFDSNSNNGSCNDKTCHSNVFMKSQPFPCKVVYHQMPSMTL